MIADRKSSILNNERVSEGGENTHLNWEGTLKRISYILTPQGLKEKTELTRHFLKRKQQEYEELKRECEDL
ncbi:hypothetical protein M1M93_01765 [Thermodesulfovibrionales bacterium]|nr:hypothetical protein [Thermodesulfovibrionales bacterium]MCL0041066.1 hypothetical protein [Thermodesulfovibrionales bacterium]MCL0083556.1 hypothetical protein [Thermodesulfovibrionales bacterium]MCL0083564.1 hypothetical protein [Thermodesulfovibrionales bacterium]MCL0096758.1 hypothetical protein [Thermodesulfovibrionales bacterium]